MFDINENYLKLNKNYLFSEVAKRTAEFKKNNPDVKLLRMGIGDVTLPLTESVVSAMKNALTEMGDKSSFRGYGPEQGYDFLREKISGYYSERNIAVGADEIFVSDGAKSDLGNILDILGKNLSVLIPDPVYPVYVDTNVMDGRKVSFVEATEENGFLPLPDESVKADVIYICSPNNPTGAAYTKSQLKFWVDFAKKNGSLILFDAAYERFVSEKDVCRSIYEIDGAKECAVEFCSFSKTAGFTGVRCGYTVVPNALSVNGVKLKDLWLRRQTTKFNGVGYIVQRGAEAVFTEKGKEEIDKNIAYYKENARIISEALDKLNIKHTGGVNSPYIWLTLPKGYDGWSFFDLLLEKASVVGTPGEGFGKNGKGCFRLTAFSDIETTMLAMERLKNIF